MMREEVLLSFREFTDSDNSISLHAHSPDGLFVRDIGNHQFAVVLKRNKAAIE
jgi:hypothetical protein